MILTKTFTTETAPDTRYPGNITVAKWYVNGNCLVYYNDCLRDPEAGLHLIINNKMAKIFKGYGDEIYPMDFRDMDREYCLEGLFYVFIMQAYKWRHGEEYQRERDDSDSEDDHEVTHYISEDDN